MAARTSPTRVSLGILLALGTGTGAVVTVSATVADSVKRDEPSAAAPRPATPAQDSSTGTGQESPAEQFDTASPGPITLTAVPDESTTEDQPDRAGVGPARRGNDDRPPSQARTDLPPSLSPWTPTPQAEAPAAPRGSRTPPPNRTAAPDDDGSRGPATARPSGGPTAQPTRPRPTRSPAPTRPAATPAAPADTTPPETTLSVDEPERRTVVLTFGADEAAWFACSVDGEAWTTCASPTTYSDLGPGWHYFYVVATDAAGNVDSTPAATTWHVKGGPPT